MTLQEIKIEIEEIIRRSPYSKEEVLSFFKVEEELSPDEFMAFGVALEFLRGKKSADYKKLENIFLGKKKTWMDKYNL